MSYIHSLDLLGVFAFAVYGAYKAITARFDLLGVFACGTITAFGGGTLREMILNGTPAYLHNYSYIVAAALGVTFAVVVHRRFSVWEQYIAVADAIGLAVFAYIGAYRADMAHMGLTAMLLFSTLTAAGGGILSDIISGRRPDAFYKDFYPLAAIVLALGYYIIRPLGQQLTPALVLIAIAFAVRLVSMQLRLTLWQPYKKLRLTRAKHHKYAVELEDA